MPFEGMNPEGDHKIIFDSDVECGNLDAVIKISDSEYDLFMRVDTNTKGHFSWFFFKALSETPQKVKFNICNFYKPCILYTKGMKPYIFTRNGNSWRQGGTNLNYARSSKYSAN